MSAQSNAKSKCLLQIITPSYLEKTPDSTLQEVLDFLLFVRSKELQQEQFEVSSLSEPSLAEEWLTPEEDEAWQHL